MASVSHRGQFGAGDPGIGPEGPPGPQGNPGPPGDGSVSAASYGLSTSATAADNAVALQAAIDANPGREIKIFKGTYQFDTTLNITNRFTRIVGEVAGRGSGGGTELTYTGAGAAIEIGSDNGQPHDDDTYDGFQDQFIENLWIRHASPATALLNGINSYRAGTYGIRDWRGGGIRLYNVGFEHFEYSFWGVQSDINDFENVTSLYSHYGIYAGPRSDQFSIDKLLSFYCDRAITLDRCNQFRLRDAQIVGCGSLTTAAIEIRKGTSNVRLSRPWFESFDVTDLPYIIGAGLVDGYGPGGVGTTTTSSKAISIDKALVYTTGVGSGGHARSLVGLGAATNVDIDHPETPVGANLAILDALVLAPTGTSFTAADSNACIRGVDSNTSVSGTNKMYLNEGTGTPNVSVTGVVGSGMTFATTAAAGITIKRIGGNAAEDLQIGAQGLQGRIRIVAPSFASQTTRLGLDRSIQHGTGPPVSGTWSVGDQIINQAPAVGQPVGWRCTVAGTPGTWVAEANL